ncbi:hypothetical protein [Actinophytocola sp.]|uniref:hypothetical protein n=1 Tax=Actinophytocola sp. TaxID=1872138 RepID=UPI003D6A9573
MDWRADGRSAQLMALFAAWRADLDSEPFAYSDTDFRRAWKRPACVRFDYGAPPRFVLGRPDPRE